MPDKSTHYKNERLEQIGSNNKKLLSRRCSSPILITVVNENYNNTNEIKYKAQINLKIKFHQMVEQWWRVKI